MCMALHRGMHAWMKRWANWTCTGFSRSICSSLNCPELRELRPSPHPHPHPPSCAAGYLESVQHLAARLLRDTWHADGHGRALRRGVAEFEAAVAEKKLPVDYATITRLYQVSEGQGEGQGEGQAGFSPDSVCGR